MSTSLTATTLCECKLKLGDLFLPSQIHHEQRLDRREHTYEHYVDMIHLMVTASAGNNTRPRYEARHSLDDTGRLLRKPGGCRLRIVALLLICMKSLPTT